MKTLKTGRKPSQTKQMRLTRTLNRAREIWQAFPVARQFLLGERQSPANVSIKTRPDRPFDRRKTSHQTSDWLGA